MSNASDGMTICRMPASRRRSSHGKGTIPENIVSDLQKKGRVYTARKGDSKASQFREAAAERIVFSVQ